MLPTTCINGHQNVEEDPQSAHKITGPAVYDLFMAALFRKIPTLAMDYHQK